MLTILATIGLFFLLAAAYRRGKRDGINDAIDYFISEMNKKKIDIDLMNDFEVLEEKASLGILKKMKRLFRRKNHE